MALAPLTKKRPLTLFKDWKVLLIQHYLKKMDKGQLIMRLPDKREMFFGKSPEEHKAEMIIHSPKVLENLILSGDIGLAESYMEGLWTTPNLQNVIEWFIKNKENSHSMSGSKLKMSVPSNLKQTINRFRHLRRDNNIQGSRKNIEEHYDLSNDLYKLFLDPSMAYSCGLFKGDDQDLHLAQMNKFDSLSQYLAPKENEHILEIGCGWGGLTLHLVKKYKVKVTAITISKEQFNYCQELFKKEGIEEQVELKFIDYRKMKGQFDKIISVEMIEAVGDKHYKSYFSQCSKLLKPEGRLVMQIIHCPHQRYPELRDGVDFIQKYIFPGSLLPSLQILQDHLREEGGFELYELKDMGSHYVKTLNQWRQNFLQGSEEIKQLGFSEHFLKMWNYYFEYCMAAFNQKHISVSQALYIRPNNPI